MNWASVVLCMALAGQTGVSTVGSPVADSGPMMVRAAPVEVDAAPGALPAAIPYPFRLHGKYRYLFYRAEYFQGKYDYRRLHDYPWHPSPSW